MKKITDKRTITTAGGLMSLISLLIDLWRMGYTRITVETVAEAGREEWCVRNAPPGVTALHTSRTRARSSALPTR